MDASSTSIHSRNASIDSFPDNRTVSFGKGLALLGAEGERGAADWSCRAAESVALLHSPPLNWPQSSEAGQTESDPCTTMRKGSALISNSRVQSICTRSEISGKRGRLGSGFELEGTRQPSETTTSGDGGGDDGESLGRSFLGCAAISRSRSGLLLITTRGWFRTPQPRRGCGRPGHQSSFELESAAVEARAIGDCDCGMPSDDERIGRTGGGLRQFRTRRPAGWRRSETAAAVGSGDGGGQGRRGEAAASDGEARVARRRCGGDCESGVCTYRRPEAHSSGAR